MTAMNLIGFIVIFTERTGPVNDLIASLGGGRIAYLTEPGWFR